MKQIEKELRFYDVDAKSLIKRLKGFKYEVLDYRRSIFDIDDESWLRLRTDGRKTTLTVKKTLKSSRGMSRSEEAETSISSYAEMIEVLALMGFKPRSRQHNIRILFKMNDAEVCFDYWPKLKPILEIEASRLKRVREICNLLGLNVNNATSETVVEFYKDIHIDIKRIAILDFEKRPKLPLRYLKLRDK